MKKIKAKGFYLFVLSISPPETNPAQTTRRGVDGHATENKQDGGAHRGRDGRKTTCTIPSDRATTRRRPCDRGALVTTIETARAVVKSVPRRGHFSVVARRAPFFPESYFRCRVGTHKIMEDSKFSACACQQPRDNGSVHCPKCNQIIPEGVECKACAPSKEPSKKQLNKEAARKKKEEIKRRQAEEYRLKNAH